jgi:hypothetical protein
LLGAAPRRSSSAGVIVTVLPTTVYCGTAVMTLGVTGKAAVALVAPTVLPAVALLAPTEGTTVPRWTSGVLGAAPRRASTAGVIVAVLPVPPYCGTAVMSLVITGRVAVELVAPAVLPVVALLAPTEGATVPRWISGVTSSGAPVPGSTTVCAGCMAGVAAFVVCPRAKAEATTANTTALSDAITNLALFLFIKFLFDAHNRRTLNVYVASNAVSVVTFWIALETLGPYRRNCQR